MSSVNIKKGNKERKSAIIRIFSYFCKLLRIFKQFKLVHMIQMFSTFSYFSINLYFVCICLHLFTLVQMTHLYTYFVLLKVSIFFREIQIWIQADLCLSVLCCVPIPIVSPIIKVCAVIPTQYTCFLCGVPPPSPAPTSSSVRLPPSALFC